MPSRISAHDLLPGEHVVLRMQKARRGPIPLDATFDRYHDAQSLLRHMATPGSLILPGKWAEAVNSGRRLAAFRFGLAVGVFQVDIEGRMWDEEEREIEIVSRG